MSFLSQSYAICFKSVDAKLHVDVDEKFVSFEILEDKKDFYKDLKDKFFRDSSLLATINFKKKWKSFLENSVLPPHVTLNLDKTQGSHIYKIIKKNYEGQKEKLCLLKKVQVIPLSAVGKLSMLFLVKSKIFRELSLKFDTKPPLKFYHVTAFTIPSSSKLNLNFVVETLSNNRMAESKIVFVTPSYPLPGSIKKNSHDKMFYESKRKAYIKRTYDLNEALVIRNGVEYESRFEFSHLAARLMSSQNFSRNDLRKASFVAAMSSNIPGLKVVFKAKNNIDLKKVFEFFIYSTSNTLHHYYKNKNVKLMNNFRDGMVLFYNHGVNVKSVILNCVKKLKEMNSTHNETLRKYINKLLSFI